MPKSIDLDHLFRVTVRLFGERGHAAATTQEIASQAGVSEVTLYRRFGTKAGLVAAAAIVSHHQRRGALTAGDPLQKVVQVIAPVLAEGLWRRTDVGMAPPPFDPDEVAEAFLQGHGA